MDVEPEHAGHRHETAAGANADGRADLPWGQRVLRRLHRVPPPVWPLGAGALVLAGATLLHFVSPAEPGNYPTCPWLLLTGTFCPGCGTMRAIALTTHGDILGAISMNPLLALLAPYVLWAYVRWIAATVRPPTAPPRPTPVWFLWTLTITITVFWVARNLPWFSFLAPGTPLLPGW
ncbi:Protein of unknown function [Nocardiopsis flavescens]|uniref:DUF2752 domain-containing protein n=1 Tax=Nocardiopsis flavescens TaxID=758803 RepID=A0A1M6HU78_9ACTN|nr:Protein of unknown function [Nocardiopsis flavescens]